MEEKKIFSLRLESESLEWASRIANHAYPWTRSDVIRLAIWVGKKVINSRHLVDIIRLEVHEEFSEFEVPLEDVLHAAGFTLENLKKVK